MATVLCDGCGKPEGDEPLLHVHVTASSGVNSVGDMCKTCQKALADKIEGMGFTASAAEDAGLGSAGPKTAKPRRVAKPSSAKPSSAKPQ